jgi:thioredoxin-like negative regulator of GroEL
MSASKIAELEAMVQRHLVKESRLAAELELLGQQTSELMSAAGLKGPAPEQLQAIEPIVRRISQASSEMSQARTGLLQCINATAQTPYQSLRDFIRTLPASSRNHLERARLSILESSQRAHAKLVENQTCLFYTLEFHRRYLASLLQSEVSAPSYRPDGQAPEVAPGNLFGKTC